MNVFFFFNFFLQYIRCPFWVPPIPHPIPPFPCSKSVLRVGQVFFHWGQTTQSSAVHVLRALDQLLWMLPDWGLSVWEISGVPVSWHCWASYGVTLLLSFFQPFPNSTTGVTNFSPLVGYNYLVLYQSAACWASRRTAMLGSCLWAHSNSVRPWNLPLR